MPLYGVQITKEDNKLFLEFSIDAMTSFSFLKEQQIERQSLF